MTDFLAEQNTLMDKIIRDHGGLIRSAVGRAMRGLPGADDILSEVCFAVLLTVRKLGTDWTPPKSFLYAVVRNKVNDFLREKYREKRRIEEIQRHLEAQASAREEVVSRIDGLTASEFRVFRMLGLGLTNGELADSLHLSLHTIRSHMKKIHAKCGVRDRAKLTLIAHQVCHPQKLASPEWVDAGPGADEAQTAGGRVAEDGDGPTLWGRDLRAAPVAIDKPSGLVS